MTVMKLMTSFLVLLLCTTQIKALSTCTQQQDLFKQQLDAYIEAEEEVDVKYRDFQACMKVQQTTDDHVITTPGDESFGLSISDGGNDDEIELPNSQTTVQPNANTVPATTGAAIAAAGFGIPTGIRIQPKNLRSYKDETKAAGVSQYECSHTARSRDHGRKGISYVYVLRLTKLSSTQNTKTVEVALAKYQDDKFEDSLAGAVWGSNQCDRCDGYGLKSKISFTGLAKCAVEKKVYNTKKIDTKELHLLGLYRPDELEMDDKSNHHETNNRGVRSTGIRNDKNVAIYVWFVDDRKINDIEKHPRKDTGIKSWNWTPLKLMDFDTKTSTFLDEPTFTQPRARKMFEIVRDAIEFS